MKPEYKIAAGLRAAENEESVMAKQNKLLIVVAICAIAAIAITAITLVIRDNKDKPKMVDENVTIEEITETDSDAEPAPVYHIDLTQYGGIYDFYMYFNTEAETYEMKINGETAGSGSYTREGNCITVTGQDGNGNEVEPHSYLIAEDYLLMASSMLNGAVPEGEKFSAILSVEQMGGNLISYEFKEDGTVTIISKPDDEEAAIIEGTYTREGNLLTIKSEETDFIPYYIYHDHAFTSYFVKEAAEES